MRIAFVIPGVSGGGVRSVVKIAAGLARRGHQVRVLYRHHTPSPRDLARSVLLRLLYGGRGSWMNSFPGQASSYTSLSSEIVGENDVVIGVGISCVLDIASLPPQCGIKVHNSRGVEPWIAHQMEKAWSISMPRIVVGEHLVEKMRQHGSTDPIYVARNGLDQNEYYPTASANERSGVGTVYHGGDVKDPDLILGVLNELHAQRPQLPIKVFGSYPRPRALPGSATYVRLPSTPQARDIYSATQVWFLCSVNEGLPNPLLEAVACGCAIVSTDCGGASDIIRHEENGLIVPVGDRAAMVAAINRLLDDQALREEFVNAARQILDQFTWPKAVDSFEAALLDIVARSAPRREPPVAQLSESSV